MYQRGGMRNQAYKSKNKAPVLQDLPWNGGFYIACA